MKQVVLHYSRGSRVFHWLIALLVILMLSGSFFLDDLPDRYISTAFMMHKSVGISILFLMVMRIFWIHHCGKPALPASMPVAERILARVVQYSLYASLLLMPLCGWIMSVAAQKTPSFFGLFSLPLPFIPANKNLSSLMETCHVTGAWIIITLLTLHIAGALKHHFIDKDRVMRSMLSDKT